MVMLRAFTIVLLIIIRCRFPKLKSFSEIIRFRYGNHVLKLITKYEKHNYWLRKTHLGIAFLNSCLDNDLVSTLLRYKLSSKRLQNSESIDVSNICFYSKK